MSTYRSNAQAVRRPVRGGETAEVAVEGLRKARPTDGFAERGGRPAEPDLVLLLYGEVGETGPRALSTCCGDSGCEQQQVSLHDDPVGSRGDGELPRDHQPE